MSISRRDVLQMAGVSGLLSAVGQQAWAQAQLESLKIITGFPPGGTSDAICRRVSEKIAPSSYAKAAFVENKTGAGGQIAVQFVRNAPADGATVLQTPMSMLGIYPHIYKKLSYDPVRDYAPVSLVVSTPNVMVVHPGVAAQTVGEFIALAKTRPGMLNYSSASTGSTQHLAAELFKNMAGLNIVRIPYKGSGPALNAVIAGQVQLMFPSAGSATQHVKAGRLRALAVTTAQPSALLPGLPTVAASGLPGYESTSPFGVFAPANTPQAIIARLGRDIAQGLSDTEIKARFNGAGVETVGSTPAELGAMVKAEMTKWGKLIREAGIREE